MTPTFELANLPTLRSTTQRKLAIYLGILALAVLYLLPGLLFSYKSVQEPWTLFRLARLSLSLPTGHILAYSGADSAYRAEHLGGELLQSLLVSLTGWPLEWIALLPLGALLLPALTFSVIRVTSRSTWLAFWLALFSAWYYPRLFSHYAVQTYVWTDALFLCFALLLWMWLQRPSVLLSGLLLAIFLAAFLHYQTTPLWMIVAAGSAALLARWRRTLYPEGAGLPSWSLPLVFLVIYLQFDTVFYGNFLGHLRAEPVERLLEMNLIAKVLAPLAGRQTAGLGEFAVSPLSPRPATWTTLLAILALSLPVLVWCLRKVRASIRVRDLRSLVARSDDVFIWSLLLAAAAHALVYSVYGSISLRLIDLIFPLVLPLALYDFPEGRRIANSLAPTLALCAAIGFISYTVALQPDILPGETGQVDDLLVENSRVLADANTFGGLLLNAAQDSKRIELAWLDAETYAWLTGRRSTVPAEFDYLVTDNQGKGVISQGWVFFAPWVNHLSDIERNANLDLIYASGKARVYQPAGRALPSIPQQKRSNPEAPLWPWSIAAGLLPALVMLLFAPGAVLACICLPRLVPPLEPSGTWPAFLVLSVGLSLSVNTFFGYLVNSSPLGLSRLIPISIGFTLISLAVFVGLRRPWLGFPRAMVLSISTGVIIWSLAAALVAGFRSQTRLPSVEFFLTYEDSPWQQVFATVSNRGVHPIACILEQDGASGRSTVPISLMPGSTLRAPVSFLNGLEHTRLTLTLDCNHRQRYSLHLAHSPLIWYGDSQDSGGLREPP